MKITQDEFNRFWDEVLGNDWYDDGETDLDAPDDALVDLEVIDPRWQGSASPEPKGLIKARDIDMERGFLAVTVTALFKRWRKAQTNTTVIASFDVPNDQVDAMLAQIKALKGKVIGR
jgi:hypothetical protein